MKYDISLSQGTKFVTTAVSSLPTTMYCLFFLTYVPSFYYI